MCNGVGLLARLISFARVVVFYLVSAIWILVIIAVATLRPGPHYYPLVRAWAGFTLRWFGICLQTSGVEHLGHGRDYVVLANHRSHFDPLALIIAFGDHETRWVAKRELQRVPIFGYGLRATGQILIDRSNREAAIGELKRHLGQKGASVVFFPEGRRAPGVELLPFKKGGAAFAIDAGLPIVPVAISGSEKVLPRDSIFVRPGLIRVSIGSPIEPGAVDTADRDRLLAHVRDSIESMLGKAETRTNASSAAGELGVAAPEHVGRV